MQVVGEQWNPDAKHSQYSFRQFERLQLHCVWDDGWSTKLPIVWGGSANVGKGCDKDMRSLIQSYCILYIVYCIVRGKGGKGGKGGKEGLLR